MNSNNSIAVKIASHPTMGAWIEIIIVRHIHEWFRSHPTMGAWIEIFDILMPLSILIVAPHDGCVD